MNETIPDKEAYQTNRRRMCWAALGMMIACTAATIYDPARTSDADSILMISIWRCLVWWVLTLLWGIKVVSHEPLEQHWRLLVWLD